MRTEAVDHNSHFVQLDMIKTSTMQIPNGYWETIPSDVIKEMRKNGIRMSRTTIHAALDLSNRGHISFMCPDVCWDSTTQILFKMNLKELNNLRDRCFMNRKKSQHSAVMKRVSKALEEMMDKTNRSYMKGPPNLESLLILVQRDKRPNYFELMEKANYFIKFKFAMVLWEAFHIVNPIPDLEDKIRGLVAIIETHQA